MPALPRHPPRSAEDSAANTGAAAGDTYANIENLTGSNFADNLFGNANGNILEGRGGADRLDGGGGADTASYAGSTAGVNVQLQ